VPDYWKLDAMVSYKVDEKSTLQVNVYNITDKLYYSQYSGGQRCASIRTLGVVDLQGSVVTGLHMPASAGRSA